MTIEELKQYLEKEIAYFKKLRDDNGMNESGRITLEIFEYILKKIECEHEKAYPPFNDMKDKMKMYCPDCKETF